MLRFIGQYTNGQDTITYLGCTFEGREPRAVPQEVADLLHGHPEFEVVDPLDHDGDGEKGGSLKGPSATRNRRPKKVADK